jgi:hypothetical protein
MVKSVMTGLMGILTVFNENKNPVNPNRTMDFLKSSIGDFTFLVFATMHLF